MKKFIKSAGLVLLIIIFVVFTYYLYELSEARKYTITTISSDLTKAQWREPDGPIKKFGILSQDLTTRQKEILLKVQDPGFYNHNGVDLSTPGAGLTTITQAIVKKLYFDNFKPGISKIKQTLIARFVVDRYISKKGSIDIIY